jgi:hypothetical protein
MKAAAFAAGTTVPVEKTRAEIEKLLTSNGATEYGTATKPGCASITFRLCERWVRFDLVLPDRKDVRFTQSPRGRWYNWTEKQGDDAYAAEIRRLWRALLLVLKAKLEAARSGIATFESEFLAYIVVAGGRTVGQDVIPQIREAYESGRMRMPLLLTDGGGDDR